MSLTNMRTAHEEQDKMLGSCEPCCDDAPAYPYGLSIYLNESSLAKLSMSEMPPVGTKLMLTAMVEVTSISSQETTERGATRDLGLQITDLSLDDIQVKASPAQLLYPTA